MREHIKNGEYPNDLRFILLLYRKVKQETDAAKRRENIAYWKNEIQDARKQLRKIGQEPDRVVVTPNMSYPEYYTIIYKKPFEFDGTKDEFATWLWDNFASYCAPSQYDCTGQHFTTGFKIAHIGGNRWRVAESMGVDV